MRKIREKKAGKSAPEQKKKVKCKKRNRPELINCMPTQNEMTYLWQAMAKKRYHTPFGVPVRPIAMPSKTA